MSEQHTTHLCQWLLPIKIDKPRLKVYSENFFICEVRTDVTVTRK